MRKLFLISVTAFAIIACEQQTSVSEKVEVTKEPPKFSKFEMKAPKPTWSADNIDWNSVTLSPEIEMLQKKALAGSYGYDITESLTTEIGQRLAGSPEEAKARLWAVEKFKSVGLSNVHIEEFDVPGWVRGVETAEIISPFPQKLEITALGGSAATPAEGIEAEVVYFPTFDDLKNAPEGGLDGKIAFISGRMEKAHDGAGYGPANQKRQLGATEAGKRGASAVIIRSVGTDSHRFPHTGQMRYRDEVKPIPIGALSAPDADQLERIIERGETISLKLIMTPKSTGTLVSGNVVGDIVGSEKPEEIILIGGHLDSWDLGTGAVDDAAGVGITLGAAQLLLESGLKPKRTIRVVAFGSEEVGLVGAFAYANRHKDNLANHVLASESDFGAGPIYALRTSVKGPARSDLESFQKSLSHLGVEMEDGPTSGGPDIIPLFRSGVPVFGLQQNGYDYFDLHHTHDDTFDKIDPEHMAQNVAAWATMIWMASEAEVDFREDVEAVIGE